MSGFILCFPKYMCLNKYWVVGAGLSIAGHASCSSCFSYVQRLEDKVLHLCDSELSSYRGNN